MSYLSPTSLKMFISDRPQFYMQYLADNRMERLPQTAPMAVGSSFDAFAKSYLYNALFGKKDPRFELMAIFEAQVQPQQRDAAYKAGEYVFEQYKKSGALVDMMLELKQSVTEPRFEFEIMGQVEGQREGMKKDVGPIPFLGKPDIYFTNAANIRVIYDWKVNGYYSKYNTSPKPGYIRCRDASTNYGSHKGSLIQVWNGVKINLGIFLEQIEADWARQLAIYSWLCGETVGSDKCIVGIDQIVCSPDSIRPQPKIRIAEHRLRISKEFQHSTFTQAQEAWEVINSDWIFRDMTKEESQQRCKLLDSTIEQLQNPTDSNDEWYARMSAR